MSGQEELNEFIRAVSDGDPEKERANAGVRSSFEAAAAPKGARERVLASLDRRPAFRPRRLVPAFAIGAAAVAAFLLLRPSAKPAPTLSPDWLSYDNFPYYRDEARMYLDPISSDGQTVEGLIPSAEDGGSAL